jgi:hypothetical protein
MKKGDVASNGRVFWGYRLVKRKDGTFRKQKRWCSPEYYERTCSNSNKRRKWKVSRRRHWLNRYKLIKGCERCGYNTNGVALHFDHIEPSKKVGQVSKMLKDGRRKLIEEVRKCRVLCANCHAIKTYEDIQNERADV